ncbi:phage tail protein I [Paenibacillus psychroresistens]|uniref:Phage tail protein I n=1 Tax=Paenibacillus psychroresistens TaxID=1778678 RepID=A0A6B8RL64_9BACL|nr:phage tail protein I [Paenibacillus psychroresistens]QGQ97050.1 phage tail protein I [Paenibacillus psychroresistens]
MQTESIDLLALQTNNMQNDIGVRGMTAALTPQFMQLAEQIINELIYTRIDDLPESALDILAWQFNVDWYVPDSDLTTKRQAINGALLVKKIQGTPAAVQRVVEIYFGDGEVEEWFDYGGSPFYFRVVTNNPRATGDQAALLIKAVNSVKNLRSRLESVIIQSVDNMDLYFGFALQMTDNLTLKQVV